VLPDYHRQAKTGENYQFLCALQKNTACEIPLWDNSAHSKWIRPIIFGKVTDQSFDVLLSCCNPLVYTLQRYAWDGTGAMADAHAARCATTGKTAVWYQGFHGNPAGTLVHQHLRPVCNH